MKKITMPVTPDGNDPADFDQPTLDKLNEQIDEEHSLARDSGISVRDARDYVEMYARLKSLAAVRGNDLIRCPITNAKYKACCAVLKREDT